MGAMSLCVASYLPFSVNCFMNGHSYVAGELRRAGVAFRREDNAIVRCTDPRVAGRHRRPPRRAHPAAARQLLGQPPGARFSARERAACQLHYQWSVAQIEFARDVIFQRRARLRDLFRRAVEIAHNPQFGRIRQLAKRYLASGESYAAEDSFSDLRSAHQIGYPMG